VREWRRDFVSREEESRREEERGAAREQSFYVCSGVFAVGESLGRERGRCFV